MQQAALEPAFRAVDVFVHSRFRVVTCGSAEQQAWLEREEKRCVDSGAWRRVNKARWVFKCFMFYHSQIGARCTGQEIVPADCRPETAELALQGVCDALRDIVEVSVRHSAGRDSSVSVVRHSGRVPFSAYRSGVPTLLRNEHPCTCKIGRR